MKPLLDLPQPSTDGKDELTKFELSLPFCRTDIAAFNRVLTEAETDYGKANNSIDFQTLRKHFTTSSWAQLDDNQSPLRKLLALDQFQSGQKDGSVSVKKLRIFALLNCQGSKSVKALGLFDLF